MKMRMEADSIGTLAVPESAYYGVQAKRAQANFRITGQSMSGEFLKNLALIKKAAAIVNCQAGLLAEDKALAIEQAAGEVMSGNFQDAFIVDAVQGGAGTSANMNMNEVIANRACEILGGRHGEYSSYVHPNDHVNMAQSTNDVIPTAGKMTVLTLMKPLISELKRLEGALKAKSDEFSSIMKMGRTQLQDAVPMTLGDSFGGYASMVRRCRKRLEKSVTEMRSVNLGGTAIGSGINASDYYEEHIVPTLSSISGLPLSKAPDLYDATENLDSFVEVSGALKACAVSLSKMSNDLRLLSSGPKCGIHEINLPAMQNGSSIMPGKVNPVIPEVVTQAAFLVIGHDTTIAMAAEAGQMELNAFEPVVFYQLFESINAMKGAVTTLIDNCITGITANKEHINDMLNSSVGIATALCPYIGYQKSAYIAKKALKDNKTVREIVLEMGLMTGAELDRILNPESAARMKKTA
ncbi:MAG: aspartate ammonia-lyase [Lachnospiraceae bacterium]|nr:aspartate ammonia-lyase [Lachnospiraceae bacterium]MEE3461425.1 aspartate ammonia-lyase [Lachnospiraceae bacterium]